MSDMSCDKCVSEQEGKCVSEEEGLAQHARYMASLVGLSLPEDSAPRSNPPSRVLAILPTKRSHAILPTKRSHAASASAHKGADGKDIFELSKCFGVLGNVDSEKSTIMCLARKVQDNGCRHTPPSRRTGSDRYESIFDSYEDDEHEF